VNNAGVVALTGGVLNETAAIWDNTIETHLNASFLLSQLVAKSMAVRRRKDHQPGEHVLDLRIGPRARTAQQRALSCNSRSLWLLSWPVITSKSTIAPGWIETGMTDAAQSLMNDAISRTPAALGETRRSHWCCNFLAFAVPTSLPE
jgi:NAD(P)-dependent dehydrogenase (short-subunit alcohol dehydrogenase family)